jgi:hypothetical protein
MSRKHPENPTSRKHKDPNIQGEGDYESARRYRRDVESFMERSVIEELAREAEPDSEEEARELLDAERKGRARSKARRRDDTDQRH